MPKKVDFNVVPVHSVNIEIKPFGGHTIEFRGVLADQHGWVTAEVLDVWTIPIVSATLKDARAFAQAILEVCQGIEVARTLAQQSPDLQAHQNKSDVPNSKT